MDLSTSTPVVTGASRGLGRALVDALLDRGVGKVYALAREISRVREDDRVVPLGFDLLDRAAIAAAAAQAGDATVLVNNASAIAWVEPFGQLAAAADQMAANYLGTYATIEAFVPVLEACGGGHVVNILSVMSLAGSPGLAGYSASKAAMHSLTQSLRPTLRSRGIQVHAVYPGAIDTEMLAEVETLKTAPEAVASAILDGLIAEQEEIYPDAQGEDLARIWLSDPKSLARMFAEAA